MREGGREGRSEGGWEGGSEGGRERGSEGGKEGVREFTGLTADALVAGLANTAHLVALVSQRSQIAGAVRTEDLDKE